MTMRQVLESVFSDFGVKFICEESTEARSLLKDYLKQHFELSEASIEAYVSTTFAIARAIEWRSQEFGIEFGE